MLYPLHLQRSLQTRLGICCSAGLCETGPRGGTSSRVGRVSVLIARDAGEHHSFSPSWLEVGSTEINDLRPQRPLLPWRLEAAGLRRNHSFAEIMSMIGMIVDLMQLERQTLDFRGWAAVPVTHRWMSSGPWNVYVPTSAVLCSRSSHLCF